MVIQLTKLKKLLAMKLSNSQLELNTISKKLVQEGIIELAPDLEAPYIFLHGQSSLLEDEIVAKDLDRMRNIFDDIENKSKKFLNILESTSKGKVVYKFLLEPKIFYLITLVFLW